MTTGRAERKPPLQPDRVKALRDELRRRKLNGLIVPRQDEFQGEYVAGYAERLRWLTGFAGSWGMAILTLTKGAIFVDGRYTIQVRSEVDTRVFEPQHLVEQPPADWIRKNVRKGERLGFDPWLLTADQAERFARACAEAGAKLVPLKTNPIDGLWTDQPARPSAAIAAQPTQFAGRKPADKLKDVADALVKAKCDAVVLTLPDSVAWVFNIRGADVPYTPVVLAYAILHRRGKAEVFVDPSRVPDDVADQLARIATVRKPAAIDAALAALGRAGKRVLIDPAATPAQIRTALAAAGTAIVDGSDPCVMPKARKNTAEQQGARAAQLRDGVAVSRFLRWLERTGPQGGLTELDVAARLRQFRQDTGMLLDLSFDTISAAGPNAAIPHYRVSERSNRKLGRDDIYLIDSGAQYQDGTTDITRTTAIGQPTEEMRDRFTRVLKGMIGVSRMRFPKGTCGSQLDAMARAALWQAGLDYDHGTGHGVGSYLSVHEGPARINKSDRTPLEPGMILSNEPGYYKQGSFGIRIENLLLVHEPRPIDGGDRPMLGFETLTLCPIDRRLIDPRLLDPGEAAWLDAYHGRVLKEVGDFLSGDELEWLRAMCAALA